MSSGTLLHSVGGNNKRLDVVLTLDYWVTKIVSHLEGFLNRLTGKVLVNIRKNTSLLHKAYKTADTITSEEAQQVYPRIIELREIITRQNRRFASIEYGQNPELKTAFISLVRMINRTEARIHKQLYKEFHTNETPSYIKDKMAENSKKMIGNALQEEANN